MVTLFTNDLNDPKLLIDLIVHLIPFKTRPKCLIVFSNQNTSLKKEINNVLKYAWLNKILDFTIIKEDDDHEILRIYNYNPFNETFNDKEFKNEVKIFPNKFKDVKNYTMKIGFGENMNQYYIDPPGFLLALHQHQFLIRFVIEAMNFNLKFLEVEQEDKSEYIHEQKRHVWFEKTEANLIGDLVVVTDSLINLVVSHWGKECRAVVAVVPRLYKSKIKVPLGIFVVALVIPGIIFFFIKAMQVLKITNDFNGIFDIIHILMGQTVENFPRKIPGRIIFMTIVIFFVYTSNEFYSGILEISLGQEEIQFKSFEDLDKSELILKTPIKDLNYIYSKATSPVLKSLEKKTSTVENCVEELKKTKNHICIEWEYDTIFLLSESSHSDDSAYMKIVDPPIFCDDLFFRFEYASAFMKRFAEINQMIVESGIMKMEFRKNKLGWGHQVEVEKSIKEEKKILNPLLTILVSGYTLSTVMFIIECSVIF